MAETMHTIIVTRDEAKNIGCFFVEVWLKGTNLKKIEGEWVPENNVEKITRLPTPIFKQILGYVPDVGSKETKTIDNVKLGVLKRS